MNKMLPLLVMLLLSTLSQSADIIGYLPHYRINENVLKRAKLCTDIVYFGSEMTESGVIKLPAAGESHLAQLQKMCRRNKVRLHLCLGGWAKDKHFAAVTASAEKRAVFLKDLKVIVEKYDLAGVDYDWEYPQTPSEMTHFASLCKETKAQQGKGFLVTAAFNAHHNVPRELTTTLDRVHLMTYDERGKHCEVSFAEKAITDWRKNGVPSEKLCIGAAFYSRKIDQREKVKTYAQLVKEHGLTKVNQMPVDGYFGDNQSSLVAKSKLIRREKIRGVIIWELGQDSHDESSLLLTLSRELK